MNNVNNGNVCGGGGAEIALRKLRESRLKNRVKSPVSIKIEDDSDDESVEPQKNGDGMDKSVQTDNVFLMEVGFILLFHIVWFPNFLCFAMSRDPTRA